MAQIARVDNPLLGPGLTLGQRLCYFNAMLHFFYGLPRLVFLTAPLSYLLLGAHVFEASALMIACYALPHIAHANLTNSRIQGSFRHSFWNEVYESVLAWYILRPVLVAFVNPRLGKFNVTAKGGVIEDSFFDWGIARPYVILLALNGAGLAYGLGQLALGHEPQVLTLAINLLWTANNVVLCSASVAVAGERRQVRAAPRVAASLPATLRFANGRTLACRTTDFAQSGLGLTVPVDLSLAAGTRLQVSLFRSEREESFPAEVAFCAGGRLGLRLDGLSVQQQADFAELTFGRADAWLTSWGTRQRDRPLASLRNVVAIGGRGLVLLATQLAAALRARLAPRQRPTSTPGP